MTSGVLSFILLSIESIGFDITSCIFSVKSLISLLNCPQILARSSSEGLQGLLSIIESALTSSSPTTNTNQPSSTTCQCLATLLDSLGNACQDRTFQKTILQSRKSLLFGLSNCLSYHVPLLSDARFVRLFQLVL
ncbi:unnamed protein product [Schistosoma mattheei]|uniref:Uncharacterized protein n=1 Tax=Schistosoma mattheei TaxID=31246 RepID=A0A183PXN3_9TREM|nr:unnamed protein product [Schistosoma mattheei]